MMKCRGMGKAMKKPIAFKKGGQTKGHAGEHSHDVMSKTVDTLIEMGKEVKKRLTPKRTGRKPTRQEMLEASKTGGKPKGLKKGGSVKDACYKKVKAQYKVFPSAYASGAIAKCRKNRGK